MDLTLALTDLLAFVRQAGDFALANQGKVAVHTKLDKTVVTETDLAISAMAQQALAPWLAQPGHVLVDEESIGDTTPEEVFAQSEYQWVLDPVDGTASYSMGRNGYGVSLGLLHRGQPLLGAMYMPAKRELFYTDGTAAWRVQNPWTPAETKTRLAAQPFEMNGQVFVETQRAANLDWKQPSGQKRIWPHRPDSATEGATSALARQAAGYAWGANLALWDVAAAAAMAKVAGFAVRSMEDGKDFSVFGTDICKPNWKLKEGWLMCHADNFTYIRNAILGVE